MLGRYQIIIAIDPQSGGGAYPSEDRQPLACGGNEGLVFNRYRGVSFARLPGGVQRPGSRRGVAAGAKRSKQAHPELDPRRLPNGRTVSLSAATSRHTVDRALLVHSPYTRAPAWNGCG